MAGEAFYALGESFFKEFIEDVIHDSGNVSAAPNRIAELKPLIFGAHPAELDTDRELSATQAQIKEAFDEINESPSSKDFEAWTNEVDRVISETQDVINECDRLIDEGSGNVEKMTKYRTRLSGYLEKLEEYNAILRETDDPREASDIVSDIKDVEKDIKKTLRRAWKLET